MGVGKLLLFASGYTFLSSAAVGIIKIAETVFEIVCLIIDFLIDVFSTNISFWKSFIE